MYMRYRGGGVGHVKLEVIEPDGEAEDEVVFEEADEEGGPKGDIAADGEEEDRDTEEPEDEDEDEDDSEDEDDRDEDDNLAAVESDDDEADESEQGLRTVDLIHEDLGYGTL